MFAQAIVFSPAVDEFLFTAGQWVFGILIVLLLAWIGRSAQEEVGRNVGRGFWDEYFRRKQGQLVCCFLLFSCIVNRKNQGKARGNHQIPRDPCTPPPPYMNHILGSFLIVYFPSPETQLKSRTSRAKPKNPITPAQQKVLAIPWAILSKPSIFVPFFLDLLIKVNSFSFRTNRAELVFTFLSGRGQTIPKPRLTDRWRKRGDIWPAIQKSLEGYSLAGCRVLVLVAFSSVSEGTPQIEMTR